MSVKKTAEKLHSAASQKTHLISIPKSIIIACDVKDLKQFENLVRKTAKVPGLGGYKVGFELAIPFGLQSVVKIARKYTKLPLIYDHQKAGNDIPDMGENFASAIKKAGIEAVILFPFTGPASELAWIKACQKEKLKIIVGGHMTHAQFSEDQGGYIMSSAPERIYRLAAENGVRDFVVPGNQVEYVKKYKELLEGILGKGNFDLYAPGFVSQGGDVSQTGRAAGERFHAIVGRGIYGATDPGKAAADLTTKLQLAAKAQERELEVRQILAEAGAVLTNTHVVYTSGRHGREYVNKDAIYPHTDKIAQLCKMTAEDALDKNIEVVVGPAVGGIILSNNVATQLTKMTGRDILGVYADKTPEAGFVLARGYDKAVKNKRILVVEDVLTTGGSVAKVVKVIKETGGNVIGIGAICNRGNVSSETVGAPLSSLINLDMQSWPEEDCELCKNNVPINTQVGKGKDFLKRKSAKKFSR